MVLRHRHPKAGELSAPLPAVTFDPGAYASWFESPLGRQVWADEQRALLSVLAPAPDWRVLDAGCGDGRFAASLTPRVRRVIGIDASEEMLRAAAGRTRQLGVVVDLTRADLGALPFATDSFDAVTAVTVLCFVRDPVVALAELARVVRPGGQLILGELGRWSVWAAQRRLEARLRGGPWRHVTFWSKRTLMAGLRAAGLVPLVVRGAVFYPKNAALARLLSRVDAPLGALTTVGAAFIAVAAEKQSLTA